MKKQKISETKLIQVWAPWKLARAADQEAERRMTTRAQLIRDMLVRELGLLDDTCGGDGGQKAGPCA